MVASGVMRMYSQKNVLLPANSNVEFTQGGLYVTLMGLLKDLKPGDSSKFIINFNKAGKNSRQVLGMEP